MAAEAGARAAAASAPLERLEDADLERLNELLDWRSFVLDARGRRFGRPGGESKRSRAQSLLDPRVALLDERFDLSGQHVLEFGCFEGIHTVALCRRAERVTAVDGRLENVVKTIVRCAFYGFHPTVLTCDLDGDLRTRLEPADLLLHVGVLYHLRDPTAHLRSLGTVCRRGFVLDTHYALDAEAACAATSAGRTYRYRPYAEAGIGDPFSGLGARSKWLRLDDIVSLVREAGFDRVEVVETRIERNGQRVTLVGRRD